jgi:hypothetical protein
MARKRESNPAPVSGEPRRFLTLEELARDPRFSPEMRAGAAAALRYDQRVAAKRERERAAWKQVEEDFAKIRDQLPPALSEETKREWSKVLARYAPQTRALPADVAARLLPPAPAESKPIPERIKVLKKAWLAETTTRVEQTPGEPRAAYARRLFNEPGCSYKNAESIEARLRESDGRRKPTKTY